MSSKEAKARLRKLTRIEGNTICADCHAPRPTWTSLIVLPEREEEEPVQDESLPKMLGTFICFRCSGVQRGMGKEFCVVKAMVLDQWSEEELKSIELGGNIVVNSAYEAHEIAERPEPRALMKPRKAFLKEKYVEKKYLDMDKLEDLLQQIARSQAEAEEAERRKKIEIENNSKAANGMDESIHLDQSRGLLSSENDLEASATHSSIEGSLHFSEANFFPSPEVGKAKTASGGADEKEEDEFPEDFPSFPDFDSSKPDIQKQRSESEIFADVRQSFLATVPETNLIGNMGTMTFDEFSDDKFDEEDGSSDEPGSGVAKPQTPIAFEDLFKEDVGDADNADESDDDDGFGGALDNSFNMSPKPKAVAEPKIVEEPKESESAETVDPPFLADGAPHPPISEKTEESAPTSDDDDSSHSSHISHSSDSSHSSAEDRVTTTYNAPASQDPFGAEFSFPEEPLPPPEEFLKSLDDPFKADSFGPQVSTTEDQVASDSGPEERQDILKSLDDPFQADTFGTNETASEEPASLDGGGNDGGTQAVESPFSAPGPDLGSPFDDGTPFQDDSVSQAQTQSPSLDASAKENGGDLFSMDGAAQKVDGFDEQENADPFGFDGPGNAFSSSPSKDDDFQTTPSPFNEDASDTESAPFSFDGKDNAFSTSSSQDSDFQPPAFKTSVSDSEVPFSFDEAENNAFSGSSIKEDDYQPTGSKKSVSESDLPKPDAFKENAFAAFDKPSSSLEDAFGEDAFGDQDGGKFDPFAASDDDDDDFTSTVRKDDDFFNVGNTFRVDSLSQSDRAGTTSFQVTPSKNRRRADSSDHSPQPEEDTKVNKKKPPSLESAFKRMSQRDMSSSSRNMDEASNASSSSRPSVRSVRTAPIRRRSRSLDKDEDISTPNSLGSRGKRHTLQIGGQRRKPKTQSREGSLDRGASWGDSLPEDDDGIDAFTPRAESMDERLFAVGRNDSSFDQSLARNERTESRFGGSRRQRLSPNSKATKPTRSLSPFTEFTKATKGKRTTSDSESSFSTPSRSGSGGSVDAGYKSFRPPSRTRSLEVGVEPKKPAKRMPPRNEGGSSEKSLKSSSSENVSDDGFSNLSTPRVTMAGWSAGNDSFAESVESTHSSLSRKMSVVAEETTVSSFTHVADELSASVGKNDLPKRRSSGPKQRNHVKIESARSKVRKKEEALATLMSSSERRPSLPTSPSLRMKLEADEAGISRKGTSVDGGLERQKQESDGTDDKDKFVLFPGKTNAPDGEET